MLAHNVYFTLEDASDEAQSALIAACKKLLTDHPGTVSFFVGRLAEGLERNVNDRNFQVALNIIFQDRAAHDAYQQADRHEQFVAENKANWKQVRVFDAEVSSD
jgi:hypothetical protein